MRHKNRRAIIASTLLLHVTLVSCNAHSMPEKPDTMNSERQSGEKRTQPTTEPQRVDVVSINTSEMVGQVGPLELTTRDGRKLAVFLGAQPMLQVARLAIGEDDVGTAQDVAIAIELWLKTHADNVVAHVLVDSRFFESGGPYGVWITARSGADRDLVAYLVDSKLIDPAQLLPEGDLATQIHSIGDLKVKYGLTNY